MRGVCQRLSCSGSHIPDRKDWRLSSFIIRWVGMIMMIILIITIGMRATAYSGSSRKVVP